MVFMECPEEWRKVPDYPGYLISNEGRLSLYGRVVKAEIMPRGYIRYPIGGKRTMAHQLVLRAFIGPLPPDKEEINHKNGITGDNRLDNLEYVTKSENQRHSVDVLGKPAQSGSKHGCHILTEKEVLEIRALRPAPGDKRIRINSGELKQSEIASRYGVSVQTISLILNRTTWRHI